MSQQTLKITSWNVNSVKARLPLIVEFLRTESPDVCGFQEIKCLDEAFPTEAFEALGYNVITHGQKSYNGVALLSKFPLSDIKRGLDETRPDDLQSRYIEALIEAPCPVRVACIYLPNGNPVGTEKYSYKLDWLDRLTKKAQNLLALEEASVIMGDYNIIPKAIDCHKESVWIGDALYQTEVRQAFQTMQNLGLSDAYGLIPPVGNRYTFWDYQAGAWQKDEGIRIDHHLLSPKASDRLLEVIIHKDERGRVHETAKPSDHVPISIVLTGH